MISEKFAYWALNLFLSYTPITTIIRADLLLYSTKHVIEYVKNLDLVTEKML